MNERGGLTRISAIYHLSTNFFGRNLNWDNSYLSFFYSKTKLGMEALQNWPQSRHFISLYKLPWAPLTKNSGENVKKIREISRGSSEKRTRTVFHCPTITDNLYFICVDYLTYEGSFVVFSYSDVAINWKWRHNSWDNTSGRLLGLAVNQLG